MTAAPAPVYLISGDDLLADEAIAKVRAQVGADPLSEVSFGGDAAPSEIVEALATPSLLGGGRLVLVRDAHELKKDAVAAIEAHLESPSPDSTLVLVASGRTRLAAIAKKAGTVITLEAPRGRRLVSWTRERARSRGLSLDERAAYALVDAVGTELRDLDGALTQLSTAHPGGGRIDASAIRKAFPRLADERIYVFTDAVGDRRVGPAMGALRRLLDQGDEPLVLFGALSAHMRRILVAREFGARGGVRAIGEVLGLPEWRAERLARQARAYRPDEIVEAIGVLAATDVEMKGGDVPPEMALERAVLQIVGALKR